METFRKSLVAGILIGFGIIINNLAPSFGLGAFLFSFGLLTIIYMQLPLYTGKIGFLAPNLPIIFAGNCLGILLTSISYHIANPAFLFQIKEVAELKFSRGFFSIFFCGIFCGMLIHFAVKQKQLMTTIMAVMIFILIGSEHCIADFPYYIMVCSPINTVKFLLIILGNSIGAIFIEYILNGFDKKEKL